jgi:hypothetical protein
MRPLCAESKAEGPPAPITVVIGWTKRLKP